MGLPEKLQFPGLSRGNRDFNFKVNLESNYLAGV